MLGVLNGGTLTIAVKAGKRNELLGRIFVAHHGWLRAKIKGRTGDASEADDVASETFARLVALPKPQAIREPRALLTTIARRVLYDIWRRRDLEKICLDALAARHEDAHPSEEQQVLLMEAVGLIDQVLGKLSRKERDVFLMYKLDRMGYQQIAGQVGLSPSQVRRIVAKGLRLCLTVAAP